MGKSRIEDNASIRKIKEDMQDVRAMRIVWPFLRPFMRLAGADVTVITEALNNAKELESEAQKSSGLADRFNDHFAERGFIAFDLLNLTALKNAVKKADAGQVDEAEQDLVDYYNQDNLQFHLGTMKAVTAYRPRADLVHKAMMDYLEGRYHACVPEVLAITDGMVNEVSTNRRGMSAEEQTLEAWDTIAGHSSGLSTLIKQVGKGRQATRPELITFPYRNGILHGMNLGYDNKVVAAKSWALMFAVREWALKAQSEHTEEPPPTPKPAIGQQLSKTFHRLKKIQEFKEAVEAWTPRQTVSTKSNEFAPDSPEFALTCFLDYWVKRNYGKIAEFLPAGGFPRKPMSPKSIRDSYSYRPLSSYIITGIEDKAAAATHVKAELHLLRGEQETTELWDFRMICEGADGHHTLRGLPGSRWILYVSTEICRKENTNEFQFTIMKKGFQTLPSPLANTTQRSRRAHVRRTNYAICH